MAVEFGYIKALLEDMIERCILDGWDQPLQGQAFGSENYNIIVRGYDPSCHKFFVNPHNLPL